VTLPSSVGGRTTEEVGFFQTDHVRLATWLQEGLDVTWTLGPAGWHSIAEAATALSPTAPLSRYALLKVDEWALVLNNGPLGTDVGVLPIHAVRDFKCRVIRAVCAGDDDPGYPARILEVYGPNGEAPLLVERSIVAANDGGRWIFETSGKPFDFEDGSAYRKSIISQRFSCELLYQYLRLLGVPIDTEPDWATGLLLERR